MYQWKIRLDQQGKNVARRIFCDKCGRELKAAEAIQLLEYDLCIECCKKTIKEE